MTEDTIAAISTPIGEGGIAIIRVSGSRALSIADRIFSCKSGRPSDFPSHTIHFGRLTHSDHTLDHCLLAIMRAPHSYTTEDTVEFNCHGGILLARTALQICLAHGARLAEPGEFTRRAFLNGRLDLSQAEAVMDLISAKTDRARVAATSALEGHLSKCVESIRTTLMNVLAHIEAQIDFPEDDLTPDTREHLLAELEEAHERIFTLLKTRHEGKILRQGISVVIVGRPNAGKSSLMNMLLGENRSIVTSIAGTTRDTIDEYTNIRGIPVRLTDTAGIRQPRGNVENHGILRTHKAIQTSDVVIHVIDSSKPVSKIDISLNTSYKASSAIVALNKIDLQSRLSVTDNIAAAKLIRISCVDNSGLGELQDAISSVATDGSISSPGSNVFINERHGDVLRRALSSLSQCIVDFKRSATLDVVAQSLRGCTTIVGEVVGRTSTEDLLDTVFSKFCIGK